MTTEISDAVESPPLSRTAGRTAIPAPTNRFLSALGLFILSAAIFIGCAIAPPALLDDADSTHAEVAREMAESNDWVTLKMDGIRYYEKDPLMYWMIAGSFRVLGVNEFAARLPIALFAVLATMGVWALGGKMFGDRAGFYSGLVFTTAVGPFLFTRILIPDILLAGLLAWGLYFFVRGLESEKRKPLDFIGLYLACALGFLTKSMIGVAFPGGIVLLYLVLTGRLNKLRQMGLMRGILIFLLIAAPWVILAGMRNERFLWFHFINEQIYRYLGKRYPNDYDTVPVVLFYGLHALWLFPWTYLFPSAASYIPRGVRHLTPEQDRTLLLLISIGVIIGFFTFSTRQEYYTLPALPAFAILCGRVLRDLERGSLERDFVRRAGLVGHWILFGIGIAAAIAAVTVLIWLRGMVLPGDISTALTRHPEYYALSLGHIFDLTPASFAALRAPVLGAGMALGIGCTLSLACFIRRRVFASAIALAFMMAILFFWTHESLKVFEPYLSSRPLAVSVLKTLQPGEKIVINGEYEGGSTMNFYTRQPVYLLNGRSSNLWFGSFLPGAPALFLDSEDFKQEWLGGGRVYLHTDASQSEEISRLVSPAQIYVVAEAGNKQILSNRP